MAFALPVVAYFVCSASRLLDPLFIFADPGFAIVVANALIFLSAPTLPSVAIFIGGATIDDVLRNAVGIVDATRDFVIWRAECGDIGATKACTRGGVAEFI